MITPGNGHGGTEHGGALGHAPEVLRSRIEAFLRRVSSETGVPGIAVSLRLRGHRLDACAGLTAAGDRLTAAHRFHAGCTTKLLLAIVALELAARRLLGLDAPIAEYLPELRGSGHGHGVRVAHLLSHTSGYRGTNLFDARIRALSWDGLVDCVRAAPRLFAPGSVFSYEHTESVLLGRIVERATGRNALALVRERVLEPLGIEPGRLEHAAADPLHAGQHDFDPDAGRYLPARTMPPLPELWSPAFSRFTLSPADLAQVVDALLPAEDRNAWISDFTREHLTRTAVVLPPAAGGALCERLPVAFGLGAAEMPSATHGHNGLTYGQCTAVRFDPRAGTAVAIALNATVPHLRDYVLDALCNALRPHPPAHAPPELEHDLADFEGRYVGPGTSTVAASLDGQRLVLAISVDAGAEPVTVEVAPEAGRRLRVRSPIPQLSVAFFHGPEDRQTGLMLGLHAYRRVEKPPRRSTQAPRGD